MHVINLFQKFLPWLCISSVLQRHMAKARPFGLLNRNHPPQECKRSTEPKLLWEICILKKLSVGRSYNLHTTYKIESRTILFISSNCVQKMSTLDLQNLPTENRSTRQKKEMQWRCEKISSLQRRKGKGLLVLFCFVFLGFLVII